ncbi:SsrA-binding protein [Candidatus Woesebacteria bacterium RIFCSPHIGHO2_01_FULL_44_10]|uniref:SsrA-binding protein n=1 Tax=Candidatus Woesebacteria bacterium RIFCSPLOWO2_01_FULL_44_14 TaxID=1802525 RepID=A0A1F8C1D9_9BACT|nr:MAG: SsrA-binding protein [Candidatus Woesebacteria bacterium RIFCSPHIGHO2_01_FULL_44_10]OGM55848.1 MAG: SsrA-binding protein [Candidatus Woesebacteria bacterium RIFCSPHIGHO2_12_FULL_44_11]OGM69639.1 MAG: SsrA-binding protein [Candidatus Woesebacteria bacterium RIFCSPLOWO2_01_FULL_44_14]
MKVVNRRARFDYEFIERHEAGIVLTGAEVKAVRAKKVNISQAHARIINGEMYLINANFNGENIENPTRTKKLLLHRKEIESLETKIKAKKLTLVPVSLYTTRRLVKVEIALAKAKRKHEKREKIKKKDIEREIERELK